MNVDEKTSISSILNALKSSSVSHVAKQIEGISKNRLGKALNAAGYSYSSTKLQGWHFIGEGDEPIEKSIFDYIKRSSNEIKGDSEVSRNKRTTSSQEIHMQFTKDEVFMIKNMLKYFEETTNGDLVKDKLSLHERIKQLPTENKVRKTIVIDETIGDLFDEFCEHEKLNKSDLLHLAMADLMDIYK